MSLIEEALRRIEIGTSGSAGSTPKAAAPTSPPPMASVPTTSPAHAAVALPPGAAPVNGLPWVAIVAVASVSVLLLVLGCVIGALLNRSRTTMPGRSPSVESAHHAQTPSSPAAQERPVQTTPPVLLPQEALLRLRPKEPAAPQLQLNGIVQGVGEPFVIVNGEMVRLGEQVDGAQLMEIGDGVARFRWKNQELVVNTTR